MIQLPSQKQQLPTRTHYRHLLQYVINVSIFFDPFPHYKNGDVIYG